MYVIPTGTSIHMPEASHSFIIPKGTILKSILNTVPDLIIAEDSIVKVVTEMTMDLNEEQIECTTCENLIPVRISRKQAID